MVDVQKLINRDGAYYNAKRAEIRKSVGDDAWLAEHHEVLLRGGLYAALSDLETRWFDADREAASRAASERIGRTLRFKGIEFPVGARVDEIRRVSDRPFAPDDDPLLIAAVVEPLLETGKHPALETWYVDSGLRGAVVEARRLAEEADARAERAAAAQRRREAAVQAEKDLADAQGAQAEAARMMGVATTRVAAAKAGSL